MEWQVVGVLITLLGLLTAVVTPVVRLNSSITKLNTTMEHITKEVDGLKTERYGNIMDLPGGCRWWRNRSK